MSIQSYEVLGREVTFDPSLNYSFVQYRNGSIGFSGFNMAGFLEASQAGEIPADEIRKVVEVLQRDCSLIANSSLEVAAGALNCGIMVGGSGYESTLRQTTAVKNTLDVLEKIVGTVDID